MVVLIGDGELDEGSNLEAIQYAARAGLGRLTAVVIDNESAKHGWPGGIAARFEVEGWRATDLDGHNRCALEAAFTSVGPQTDPARGHRPRRPGGLTMTATMLTDRDRCLDPTCRRHDDGAETMRDRFYRLVPELLDDEPRAALVLAVIGADYIDRAERARLGHRIIDVGIREQLLLGVAGGLALTGARPIVHTFAPFLLERAFEQVKLDLGHQGVGALLVSAGGSYDMPKGGETHLGRRDVALLDTLDGWTVHVPGHPRRGRDLAASRPATARTGSTSGSATRATPPHSTCAGPDCTSYAAGAPPAARPSSPSARCWTAPWPPPKAAT